MLSTIKTYSYLSLHKSKDLHAHGPLVEDVTYYIMTAAQAEGVSEGQRAISWIWRTAGVRDSSPAIQEGMYGHSTLIVRSWETQTKHLNYGKVGITLS
jgi:hypothetical protein